MPETRNCSCELTLQKEASCFSCDAERHGQADRCSGGKPSATCLSKSSFVDQQGKGHVRRRKSIRWLTACCGGSRQGKERVRPEQPTSHWAQSGRRPKESIQPKPATVRQRRRFRVADDRGHALPNRKRHGRRASESWWRVQNCPLFPAISLMPTRRWMQQRQVSLSLSCAPFNRQPKPEEKKEEKRTKKKKRCDFQPTGHGYLRWPCWGVFAGVEIEFLAFFVRRALLSGRLATVSGHSNSTALISGHFDSSDLPCRTLCLCVWLVSVVLTDVPPFSAHCSS